MNAAYAFPPPPGNTSQFAKASKPNQPGRAAKLPQPFLAAATPRVVSNVNDLSKFYLLPGSMEVKHTALGVSSSWVLLSGKSPKSDT